MGDVLELGCIADDLTGATDIANEFAANGLETVLVVGDRLADAHVPATAQAVVVALKSRSIDPALAVGESLAAMRWLRGAGARRIYFKYCSTFDSTPQGNIGPVLEALADALGVSGVIACPAFPAAGRTVFNGNLFVGTELLSESGMRNHPLNPMRDSNLVRVLQAQSAGQVGLLSRREMKEGDIAQAVATRAGAGATALIADAVDDEDLRRLGHYCASVPLATGGSGLGAGIAAAIAGDGGRRASAVLPPVAARRAIVAGSCSLATRRQVEIALAHYPAYRVRLSAGQDEASVLDEVRGWIDRQNPAATLMVYSTASPEEVKAQNEIWGGNASAALERILGAVSALFVERGVRAMIVAGGETSGAAIQALGSAQLAIGPEIAPGVPWTVATLTDGEPLLLALKSGNFGTDDFMMTAWEHLQ